MRSTTTKPLIWLISSNNESPGDAGIRVTAHHNLFDGTNEAEPADHALEARIRAGVGWQDVPPLE